MDQRMSSLEQQHKELSIQLAVLTTNVATLTNNVNSLTKKMDDMVALKNQGMGMIAAFSIICMVIGYFMNHLLARI